VKVLFICNQNRHRSPTAAELFRGKFETKSAGLYSERPVSEKEISWADEIIVMEEEQRVELAKRFPELVFQKKVISLDVPDTFYYNQPELVELLKLKEQELA
jgi:predicted protein tyrosine phosphatase